MSLFSSKNTYAYLIVTGCVLIIIGLLLWNCNHEGYLCFQSLDKPLACWTDKCLFNIIVTIIYFTGLWLAGSYVDYMAIEKEKTKGYIDSVRILWLSILLIAAIWYILLFIAVNIQGALVAALFLNILTVAYMYVAGNSSGQPVWVIAGLFIISLILFGYTNCLYMRNFTSKCTRNGLMFCC